MFISNSDVSPRNKEGWCGEAVLQSGSVTYMERKPEGILGLQGLLRLWTPGLVPACLGSYTHVRYSSGRQNAHAHMHACICIQNTWELRLMLYLSLRFPLSLAQR